MCISLLSHFKFLSTLATGGLFRLTESIFTFTHVLFYSFCILTLIIYYLFYSLKKYENSSIFGYTLYFTSILDIFIHVGNYYIFKIFSINFYKLSLENETFLCSYFSKIHFFINYFLVKSAKIV